jgi:thiamine biosynthesis protein ThiS
MKVDAPPGASAPLSDRSVEPVGASTPLSDRSVEPVGGSTPLADRPTGTTRALSGVEARPASDAAPRPASDLELVLNGEPCALPSGATILDLVARLGRDPRTVAVERNGHLVPRAQYAEVALQAGDRLEVVHFVQGG